MTNDINDDEETVTIFLVANGGSLTGSFSNICGLL